MSSKTSQYNLFCMVPHELLHIQNSIYLMFTIAHTKIILKPVMKYLSQQTMILDIANVDNAALALQRHSSQQVSDGQISVPNIPCMWSLSSPSPHTPLPLLLLTHPPCKAKDLDMEILKIDGKPCIIGHFNILTWRNIRQFPGGIQNYAICQMTWM